METIEKLDPELNQLINDVQSEIIDTLINKINELTEKVNELNYTVGVLHEWKLQKEGI